MSENEKFTAEVAETVAESVTEQDIELATPQESNPLENESAEVSETEKENTETNAEEVEKETTDTENTQNGVHSKKKIGAVIAACAVLALSLSTVGLFGLSNRGAQATVDTTDTSASSKTDAPVITEEAKDNNSAVVGTISWWKAGVEEYDFINIDEDMMATTTTVATTTVAPETTTTAPETTTVATTTPAPTTTTVTTTAKKDEYTEEEIEKVTFYLTTNVNLRKGPGTSFDKITTLKKNTAVTAVAKVSNGWYKVQYGDYTGYLIDDYLTKTQPVTTTTTTTTTTTKPAETASSDEESESAGTEPVVSYTDEELEMLYYVVEGEVGGCSEESKLAVANVIINRVQSPRFANTLKGVMTAKSQFTAINNYYSKSRTPTASTIDCVNRALYGEDNSNGAVYFYSAKYCSASTIAWFESLTFCLEIDGQRYFK